MADDEPYDSLGGSNAPPTRKSSTPNAPPSFAFDHGGNMMSAPPATPTTTTSSSMSMSMAHEEEDEDELGAIPTKARAAPAAPPSVMTAQLNDRWKQYETDMNVHRNESSLENYTNNNTAQQSPPEPYADYRVSPSASANAAARTELSPRQPYSFRKNDTDSLIRKYGGVSGISGMPPSSSSSLAPKTKFSSGEDVRDQAQKMLNLVDDHLKSPIDIRRTESGGFRAAPSSPGDNSNNDEDNPYSFHRSSSSSSNNASGKRVPAALSGLNLSNAKPANNWKESGRYSFKDPSFRDDDLMSDDEDVITRNHVNDGPFQDEPVVDVVGLENRGAGSRAYSDEKKFEGDFEGGSKTWSSRYSDTSPYVSQKHVLDKWDREFEQEQQGHQQQNRKSARNMFMSTASNIRSSAGSVFSSTGSRKQQIFGSGGFSFRANHVFGHHNNKGGADSPEVNLRTVWRDVDDDSQVGPPPVHKTWQEVMLNKRKRRRILGILVLLTLGGIAAASALTAIKNRQSTGSIWLSAGSGESAANVSSDGQGLIFYVTSDTPYDDAADEEIMKDLANMPMDSEFVIHLGNIQEAAVSMCSKNKYTDAASVLKKSPVPLFILPGAEDWTKCPKPDDALYTWMENFYAFDRNFKHAIQLQRNEIFPEAFSFLHKGVLFVGLHVVSGPVVVDDMWEQREIEMIKWYFGQADANKGNFRSIVLLGNARPSAQQTSFFDTLFASLTEHDTPIVYIHANQKGDDVLQYNPFKDHKQVEAIGAQSGSSFPPLKITIGFGDRPFMVG